MKKAIVISTIVILIALSSVLVYSQFIVYKNIPLADIEKDPQIYDQKRIEVEGIIIENVGAFFGARYTLAQTTPTEPFKIEDTKKIALNWGGGSDINFSNYVSYIFNGADYAEVRKKRVVIEGTMIYYGDVLDAPPYYIAIDNIQ